MAKAIKKWYEQLKFIFKPRYWSMSYPYSEVHDKIMRQIIELPLERAPFNSYHTVLLGGVEIWIANAPYAMGIYSLHQYNRPSREMIMRLEQRLRDNNMTRKDLERQEKLENDAAAYRIYKSLNIK